MAKLTAEQIQKGILPAIAWLTGSPWQGELSFDALFTVRRYLRESLTDAAYKARFPRTFAYDHKKDRTRYSDDGCFYYGHRDGTCLAIDSYTLYGDPAKAVYSLSPAVQLPAGWFAADGKAPGSYTYNYLNEIDHFFSYWIVKYLLTKANLRRGGTPKDEALQCLLWQDMGIAFPTCSTGAV